MKSKGTAEDKSPAFSPKKQGLWRLVLLIVVIVILMVAARVFNLGDRLEDLRGWISSLGALGPVVYVFIYAAGVVLAIPGSLITIMAGVIFGSILGIAVVSAGSTIGAALAFLIARHVARESVAQRFQSNPKFHRLDELTREHGAIVVAITRLIPLFPFNLLNFGFGLTAVPFWTYVFWSWLCMLPGTVLYVVGADAVTSALAEKRVPWPLVVIFLITVAVIVLLVRQARKKLKSDKEDSKQ